MSEKDRKTKPKIRCPECSNYIEVTTLENGAQVGKCLQSSDFTKANITKRKND